MKKLYNYIVEATEGAFDKYVSQIDELFEIFPKLSEIEGLDNFLTDIIKEADYNPRELFIYSQTHKYFKIPYAFLEAIQNIAPNYPQFSLHKYGGKKIKVSIKPYGEIFETGSGSIGRVSTASQESATVAVWNKYIEEVDYFDLDNEDYIRNLVEDISTKFDTEWISTFQKQVKLINHYIISIGENPLDYKLTRYGDSAIGNAYKNFVENYTKIISDGDGQKDNFDPSDVLLYKHKSEKKIESILNSYKLTDIDSCIDCKTKFIDSLFIPKLLQGISLKKIAAKKNGLYELFNIGDNVRIPIVSNFETTLGKNQITILCKGNFNLDNMTDDLGDEIESEKEIKLVMRSFGYAKKGNEVAIDATLNIGKNPSLGKCPKRIWMKLLNITTKDYQNLPKCISIFNEYIEKNKPTIKNDLTKLIQACIKEGPNCFPFVLLH